MMASFGSRTNSSTGMVVPVMRLCMEDLLKSAQGRRGFPCPSLIALGQFNGLNGDSSRLSHEWDRSPQLDNGGTIPYSVGCNAAWKRNGPAISRHTRHVSKVRSEEHTSELQSPR